MRLTRHRKTRIALTLVAVAVAVVWLGVVAGPIEPPGPPGTPTMIEIDRVNPRIPIRPGSLPLTITESGSYYLTGNLGTSGPGIIIQTDNVTIDLMGFTLEGGTGKGIDASGYSQITVRNGTIQAWSGTCVHVGVGAAVENVTALACAGSGINAGFDSRVLDSTARGNSVHGIIVTAGCLVRGCVASANSENGIWIDESPGAAGALVSGCVVDGNGRNGIRLDGRSTVTGNQVRANGSPDKAGIWVKGDFNRIDGNNVVDNYIGLDVDGSFNVIARNSVINSSHANIDEDVLALGNLMIVHWIYSSAPVDPWANIEGN